MAVARDGRERWELRLGAAQAVTWIGLALGVTVGAYFIGFFSGRYVGFDTARSATVSEVAKLTIQEDLFDRQSDRGSSDIYSRLDGNAVADTSSFDTDGHSAGKPSGGGKKGGVEEPSSATKFAQAMREDPIVKENTERKVNDTADKPSQQKGEGAVAAAEIDSIFEDNSAKLAVSEDAAEAEVGVLKSAQKGVRVLGGDDDQSRREDGRVGSGDEASSELPSPPAQQDTSLGAILEERVAKARSAQNEPIEGKKVSDTTKGTEKNAGGVKEAATKDQVAKDVISKDNGVGATTSKLAKNDSSVKAEAKKDEPKAPTVVPAEPPSAASGTSAGTGMVKQVLPPGYFAQVAAPKRLQEAQDVARRLKRSGFPVVIETAHVRGEDYYRVLVGPEDGKVQAERLVDQLKRESYLSGTAFLRRVK